MPQDNNEPVAQPVGLFRRNPFLRPPLPQRAGRLVMCSAARPVREVPAGVVRPGRKRGRVKSLEGFNGA
jgi:hypothetical protein